MDRRVEMKIFKNITNGYRKIASGIAIVAFLTLMYFALIPAGSMAAVYSASGSPIVGALVKLMDYPQYNSTTDVNGNYALNNVPYDAIAGGSTYLVSARAPGYLTNISRVTMNGNLVYNIVLTAGREIFIPWIAYSQTGWYTPVQVQNIGNLATDVNVTMYDQNGNVVQIQKATIQPLTSAVFWPPVGATDGGSAIVNSTQNITAIVNEMPKNGNDAMAYSGFIKSSKTIYIPWIAYSQTGWYTPVQVQNVDTSNATVSISMYDQNGNLVQTQSVTLNRNTATVFWPPVASTDGGSAVITSTQNIIAIVNEMAKTGPQSMSYEGFISGSKKVYIPTINFSQTNTYTPIQIQNIGPSTATVNVSIYNTNGAFVEKQSQQIPSMTSGVFWPPSSSTPSGSAVIESTQDVIAIVNEMINNNNWAMSYDGISNSSTLINIPWIAYGNSGWSTPIIVQNTASVSATDVNISFYDQNGALVETRPPATIPANSSLAFIPPATALTPGGSAVITSIRPLVAIVHELDAAGKEAMAYNGVSE